MKEIVSVNKALIIGRLVIYLPILLLFLISIFTSTMLYSLKYYKGWIVAVGFFGGIFISFIYRGFIVVKWKIWAFNNVRNVHELKEKAILNNLIFKDSSWINKTEIVTKKDKNLLNKLQYNFTKEDIFRDDISIPKITNIYFSKTNIVIGSFVVLFITFIGLYIVFIKENYFGLTITPLVLLISYKLSKKIRDKDVQISIDDKFIYIKEYGSFEWQLIKNEKIDVTNDYINHNSTHFLKFDYNGQHIAKSINDLDTNYNKLDKLIKIYRVRFKKTI
jgi:hypothetical protein